MYRKMVRMGVMLASWSEMVRMGVMLASWSVGSTGRW